MPERSTLAIDARSNVGPIRWEAVGLEGGFEADVGEGGIDVGQPVTARLTVAVDRLTSGNSLYDAELLRRIDARSHPLAVVELRHVDPLGGTNRFQLQGDLTFHGVSRPVTGTVAVAFPKSTVVLVYGEKVIDIRDFDISSPSVLMLKILPDVRVRLSVEAEREP